MVKLYAKGVNLYPNAILHNSPEAGGIRDEEIRRMGMSEALGQCVMGIVSGCHVWERSKLEELRAGSRAVAEYMLHLKTACFKSTECLT